MSSVTKQKDPDTRGIDKGLPGFILKRALLILYDIVAVNGAYFLALMIQFYIHGDFRDVAKNSYLPAFWHFAPWYSVISIVIFAAWGLYTRRWKKADLRDFNRILAANVCTVIVMVVGTLINKEWIVNKDRMPIPYYVIGAVIQLGLVVVIRFAYRFVILERASLKKQPINVFVGTDLAANHVLSTVTGSVVVDGKEYATAKEALVEVASDQIVKEIHVENNVLNMTTAKKASVTDTSWIQDADDVSFF